MTEFERALQANDHRRKNEDSSRAQRAVENREIISAFIAAMGAIRNPGLQSLPVHGQQTLVTFWPVPYGEPIDYYHEIPIERKHLYYDGTLLTIDGAVLQTASRLGRVGDDGGGTREIKWSELDGFSATQVQDSRVDLGDLWPKKLAVCLARIYEVGIGKRQHATGAP